MRDLRNAGSAGGFSCLCNACGPSSAMSRRQFLCTGTAGAITAASVAGAITASSSPARAQQPTTAPGRPILIKGGCVLTLDRALGDFETADVLIEGKTISAVRPNIAAPNAEVIDAARMIVMPGLVDTHRHMWQGILRNVLPDGSPRGLSRHRAAHVRSQIHPGRCLCGRSI
jgi:5-methylthioadenosine/S-adenosylhomocysteine deaminase